MNALLKQRIAEMELHTFTYRKAQGWSIKSFPLIDSKNTLLIIFGAPEYLNDQLPIQQLFDAYPEAKFIGCSTAGEINGASISDHSLSVAVVKFSDTVMEQTFVELQTADDSFMAGETIANKLNKNNLQAVFVLSDGIHVNGSQLVKGLNSILTKNVVVTGGLAADGDKFKQTWVIHDHKLKTKSIAAVAFYGKKIHIGHGSQGGWDSFGPERHITRSKDNVLFELDGKPALELYKEYLGERAQGLPATGLLFPLAIRQKDDDHKVIVRTILAVDEKNQSMTFAGDVPTGYMAKLMRANFERLVQGACGAAQASVKNQTKSPMLAVAISCVGRRLLLKEYTEEETEATLESFPAGTQQIGFYSYGEISPYSTGYCDLHNQTMTITTFSEEP